MSTTTLDRVKELNTKRYVLTLTGAEAIALGGIVAKAEPSNPARRTLADKVADIRAESMRNREEAYA